MGLKLKRLRANVIRAGDTVKILHPDFFIRVGYPLCMRDVEATVKKEHTQRIVDFLREFSLEAKSLDSSGYELQYTPTYEKVVSALAYGIIRREKFGGNVRSIYTKKLPQFENVVTKVVDKRCVKTGEYHKGNYYGSMDGYEYDPPYLANEKTVRLLGLEQYAPLDDSTFDHICQLWIDANNVEKVVEKEPCV